MTTPSGTIRFSDIEQEFGQTPNQRLGDYRVSQTAGALSNIPLDDGVPTTGMIKFSDLQNKKLNIHVDYWSGYNTPIDRHDDASEWSFRADNRYNGGHIKAIQPDGATTAGVVPTDSLDCGDKKVIVNVRKKIGSEKATDTASTRWRCALRTGSEWNADTELTVRVTDGGLITGAGGNGGNGGNTENDGDGVNGTAGKNGSSALGIQFEGTKVQVDEGGAIVCGFGGGGGGGSSYNEDSSGGDWNSEDEERNGSGGGGGGGGAGRPSGSGGSGGDGGETYEGERTNMRAYNGTGGESGSGYNSEGRYPYDSGWKGAGGSGGNGAESEQAQAGNGGTGGRINNISPNAGPSGRTLNDDGQQVGNGYTQGGAAGLNGGAINRSSNSIDWDFTNSESNDRVWGEGSAGKSESPNTVS